MGLIERLPKDSVTVYTSAQGDTVNYDAQWKRDYGVTVIRDRASMLLPTPRVARNINKLARSGVFSVACFGAAAPLALLAPTLRRAGVARILSLTHGHEVWWARVFPFSWAMRRIGDQADVLTYLGEFTRSRISRALSLRARNAMVRMAPGIDTTHFSMNTATGDLRKQLGLDGKVVIVCVGRLVPRKGQDRLIQALPLLRDSIPNIHLLIVGEGSYKSKLDALVKENNLSAQVTFVGRVPFSELPSYFRCGDIFAMPSRSRMGGLEVEGLGIVYLEASACGLPVIAGNSGGAPDAVVDGVTGIVVDGRNINEIAGAIARVVSDPAKSKNMGVAGNEWVNTNWSWDMWAARFSALLGI